MILKRQLRQVKGSVVGLDEARGVGAVRVSESGLFRACRGSLGPSLQRNLGATALTFCTLRRQLGSGVCSV